jgi:hypothetical protein
MRNSSVNCSVSPSSTGGRTFVPSDIADDVDVAECALDEQMEQLQRHYAAASRAASRARFESELFEKAADVPEHLTKQIKRQRAAAETRCARLLSTIEALEDRMENS